MLVHASHLRCTHITAGNLRSAGKDGQYRLDDLNSSAADIKGRIALIDGFTLRILPFSRMLNCLSSFLLPNRDMQGCEYGDMQPCELCVTFRVDLYQMLTLLRCSDTLSQAHPGLHSRTAKDMQTCLQVMAPPQ